MIGQLVICARNGCDIEFAKTTHNQKYCSPPCTRLATNARIMENYHERAAIKKGKKRTCRGCDTSLSRYNFDKYCSACQTKMRDNTSDAVNILLGSVSWL